MRIWEHRDFRDISNFKYISYGKLAFWNADKQLTSFEHNVFIDEDKFK